MKFSIVALAAASAVSAQLVYENGEFKCLGAAANKNFCAGSSLESNIIIRCNGEKGQPGNCNDNLAGVPPVGVKSFAPCYQTSNSSGDAACSFNGIAYPDSGASYPIPGSSSSSSSVSENPYPTASSSSSSSSSEIPYPTESSTTTTEIVYPTETLSSTTGYPTEYPSSTLVTVTGTVTVTTTSCDTTTSKPYVPTGTGGPIPPPANHTTYTTGLPVPTQIPSGAGSLLARDGLVLGALAVIGFLFL